VTSSYSVTGRLRGVAFRPTDGDPMTELQECHVVAGHGIDRENRKPGKREVTLLSSEAWADTCRDLGTDLPWHARRANFLIEGLDLGALLGRTISIGNVQVHIHGETKPCGIMDQTQDGLRLALVPECRGGVFGEVIIGGVVRVNDPIAVVDTAASPDSET
jgi:MOSC domain-containing protein YiiM